MAKFYRNHRLLGGRRAADLAAVGVFVRNTGLSDDLDFEALLRAARIDDSAMPAHPHAFSANTAPYPNDASFEGIRTSRANRDDRDDR